MSARTWFTASSTPGLARSDLAVLNRAARLLVFGSTRTSPSRDDLTKLRIAYRSGMSASELVSAVEDNP